MWSIPRHMLRSMRVCHALLIQNHVSCMVYPTAKKATLIQSDTDDNTALKYAVPAQKSAMKCLRTHRVGEISLKEVGQKVSLSGWLEYKRGNTFFTIRDSSGSCQVINGLDARLPVKESIVNIEGTVQARPGKDVNPKMKTGDIEIVSTKITVLNECKNLPFTVDNFIETKEEVRMRYRYMDLRSKTMQRNLKLRSSFILKLRKFLCEERGFLDVETPTLFRRTPGGAQEFVVPTQSPGMFYSLPQSPQQFKQLLMAGGIDRYMQVAKCYRDEGAKPDRQPEFTQLDLEMSFTNQEEVKGLIEDALVQSWPDELSAIKIPFPRMSHFDAMRLYGTDKPDTRYESQIEDIGAELDNVTIFRNPLSDSTLSVRAVCLPEGCEKLKSKQIKMIQDFVQKQYSLNVAVIKIGENNVWRSPLTKYVNQDDTISQVNKRLGAKTNDLVFICAHDSWPQASMALGKCRTQAAAYYEANGYPLYQKDQYNFLWVEDFPLFEIEDGCLQSAHHPFTAPVSEDFDMLFSSPAEVRGQHYDLVLNGSEVGGGSIRIHDAETQKYVLQNILKEDSSQLGHLLNALDSGCPPHGGIALGLDRLIAIMCGAPSIRDVIAFPKSTSGSDLMAGAPCALSAADFETYKISISDQTSDK